MNLCTFVGRVTKDPEIRYSQNGEMPIAKFVLAVDRNYKAAEGEESADFFPCVAFDKRAEFAEKHLYKGIRIAINGKMRNNNYTNKNGEKVYGNSLYVDNIEFADGKRENGEEPLPQPTGQPAGTAASTRNRAVQSAGQASRTGNSPSSGQPAGQGNIQAARTGSAQGSGARAAQTGSPGTGMKANQSSGASARAGAAQPSGQATGTRNTGTARQGAASGRTAARGSASGTGAAAGRSAAARGGAAAASRYGDGFMNIPDGIEDEGLPFH